MERPHDAIPLFRKVLEQRVAAFGPADHEVGLSQNNLAMALFKLSATSASIGSTQPPWEEATDLLTTSLDCLTATAGREHPDTINTRGNLAVLRGRLAAETLERVVLVESLEQLQACVLFFSSRLSPDHPWTEKFKAESRYFSELLQKLRE